MSFPVGYSKYQEIVIDSTKVLADLTDYPIYIDLADLVKAGADIFDLCRTDGGDIRFTKDDGVTELARDIVSIDTTAKTGTIFVKFSGTLSSSSDTTIRIWYNGSDTEPAFTDTYGRDNAWDANYLAVLHLNETVNNSTDGYVDSTGNGNDGTGTSMSESARTGKLAGSLGASFDGNSDYITINYVSGLQPNEITLQACLFHDTIGANDVFFDNAAGYGRTQFSGGTGKYATSGALEAAARSTSTWYIVTSTVRDTADAQELFHSGASKATSTSASSAGTGEWRLGLYIGGSSLGLDGIMQEFRLSNIRRAANWINTEYANMNSPATFYATGDEVSSSSGVTVDPATQALTMSIPTYAVEHNARISPTAQVATFSIPAYSVSGSLTVAPVSQSIVASIPTYVIDAGGNITVAAAAQAITTSVPTYSVLLSTLFTPDAQSLTLNTTVPSLNLGTGATILPAAQTATLTLPTPVLTIERSIIVTVAAQILALSLPTLAKVGGIWTKRQRQTSADWSRRSANDT